MNKSYIIYNLDGKIVKLLTIPEEDLILNINENDKYIEGIASTTTQYIENNIIVNMPLKPDGEYVFNYITKQWEFDIVTADLKAKQKRNKLLAEGPDRINPMWWSSMTPEQQQSWTDYRQALLDITSQPEYPQEITWPDKPE